jgi:hypothetical protein
MRPHRPSRWSRLLALLVGTIASLGLAELTLRIARPARVSLIRYPCVYQPDSQLGFRYRPGATGLVAGHFEIENPVRINSLGFYDDEPLAPGESDLRVLGVGDSFTAAMNVERSAVWTAVLERELRERGFPRADVVNLGLDGTGTDVHVEILRRYLPRFEPRIVVLAFFANDFQDVLNGRFERECYREYVLSYQTPQQRGALRERVDEHHGKHLRRLVFANSYLVRLIHHAIEGPLSPYRIEFLQPRTSELETTGRVLESRRRHLVQTLRALERLGRDCACRLIVAPVPPRRSPEGSLRVFLGQAQGLALEVVDVLPALRRMLARDGKEHRDLYFEHDAHLNRYGNALYARALADALVAPSATVGDPPLPSQ